MNLLAVVFNDPKKKAPKQWVATILLAMGVISVWVFALLTFGFNLSLYLIAMIVVAGLVFVTPSAGLPIIILATMWFERWFTLQPIIFGDVIVKLYPLDIVMVTALLGLGFHQLFGNKKFKLKIKTIDKAMIAFFGICLLFMMRSFVDGEADLSLAFSSFKNYAFYGLLYFLVTTTITNLDTIKQMIKVFLVGGWGIIFYVIIGVIRGQGLWVEYSPLSTEGIRFLAFPHAFYLSVVLVISLILLIYHLRPERLTILTMWVQLVGVVGSLMRHLWLALIAVVVLFFIILPKQAKRMMLKFFGKNVALIFFLGIVLTFVYVIFPTSPAVDRIDNIASPFYKRAQSLARSAADSSARWRFFAWSAAKESIIESPIIGVGYGKQLTIEFDTYRVVVPMRDLHNSLLVMIVQMGVIGFSLFLAILFIMLRLVYQSWRARGIFFPYHAAFFGALLLLLLASLTQPYFETNLTGIFFWILSGLLISSLRLGEDEIKRLAENQK